MYCRQKSDFKALHKFYFGLFSAGAVGSAPDPPVSFPRWVWAPESGAQTHLGKLTALLQHWRSHERSGGYVLHHCLKIWVSQFVEICIKNTVGWGGEELTT